ncbi:MAG: hypothetical protein R3221_02940 [Spongiibacter sp.]|nr:hypothetical protein [Spongiibacter sp.]
MQKVKILRKEIMGTARDMMFSPTSDSVGQSDFGPHINFILDEWQKERLRKTVETQNTARLLEGIKTLKLTPGNDVKRYKWAPAHSETSTNLDLLPDHYSVTFSTVAELIDFANAMGADLELLRPGDALAVTFGEVVTSGYVPEEYTKYPYDEWRRRFDEYDYGEDGLAPEPVRYVGTLLRGIDGDPEREYVAYHRRPPSSFAVMAQEDDPEPWSVVEKAEESSLGDDIMAITRSMF